MTVDLMTFFKVSRYHVIHPTMQCTKYIDLSNYSVKYSYIDIFLI